MGFSAKILADSVSPLGVRLSTLEVTFPRIVLAEFNTHRMFSRNSASSRAIPINKITQRVCDDPFIPAVFGQNQSGMQAGDDLPANIQAECQSEWCEARDRMVEAATALRNMGVHKQLANRLLEPFMWQTCIVSATEWTNFFALRCHPAAQPEIRTIAEMMRAALAESKPNPLGFTDWHLPITPDFDELLVERWIEDVKKVSAGRCARVSYTTHHGKRDPQADIELCSDLIGNGHMSPLEHVAHPAVDTSFYANFKGWVQMRKYIPHEHDFSLRAEVTP